MRTLMSLGWVGILFAVISLAGCGGGTATDTPTSSPGASYTTDSRLLTAPNYVHLRSDAGDFIGQGLAYSYTQTNAIIRVNASGGHLTVGINGDKKWAGEFQMKSSYTQLKKGNYTNLQRYPFHDPLKGGLDWSGDGRGCNTLIGSIIVDKVSYLNGNLTAIDLRFEQHCESATPALHGEIHWNINDTSTPPGPLNPLPANLWQPAASSIPAAGNFVYLQSDTGDYIGQGQTSTYTQSNAALSVSANGGHLSIGINGDKKWTGDFQSMSTITELQPGYYADLQRYPFNNPAKGGLDWSGDGRGCNTLTGWFAVDNVTYLNGTLSAIDLRFEQHCEGGTASLHGAIHWSSSDTTTPPGPVTPPPADLWKPVTGTTPASGNFVYLQSDAGDYIGQGQALTYIPTNATLSVSASGGHLSVGINGDKQWAGDFQTMNTISQLKPGYYAGLQRYPFNNPVTGGLDWSGDGRGCNTLTGWFVVDNVTYVSGSISAIDLRFEQHCEGVTAALHGAIHWSAIDTTPPPAGPVTPPPADLWQPVAGATPASGNFVYLQSDTGDYIGQGLTLTYTQLNATLAFNTTGGHLAVAVNGDKQWTGDFQSMNTITQLQPGYYADLQRYPFYNAAKGGLNWSGDGRGCSTLTGWFVVDSVTYVSGSITAIDLRFEQHCEGGPTALHGAIHWNANDTTAPSGPVTPPPADLWQPVAGATPASGNFVYLQSETGDYIGQGQTYTYTPTDTTISVSASGGHLTVGINGTKWWNGNFQTMNTISQFQPGYYAGLQRYPFNNPVMGGLDWSGDGRGCNTLQGWFTVDNALYVNGILTAVDLRFEQHCGGATPALHGAIHWVF